MKRFLFGGSCLGMIALCVVSGFILLLVGSVLFTQNQASSLVHSAATVQTSRPAPSSTPLSLATNTISGGDLIAVTIEMPNEPTKTLEPPILPSYPDGSSEASATSVPYITATPGNAPLGADIYELTLTAQIVMNRTKGSAERQTIWATRTAIAEESQRIFATLTAEASLSPTPTGQ